MTRADAPPVRGRTLWDPLSAGAAAAVGAIVGVPTPPGAPDVVLLDARAVPTDPAGLRTLARATGPDAGDLQVCRTYRYPFALVTWHEGRVGVDLERVIPYDRQFADAILTPDERVTGAVPSSRAERDRWCTAQWSGKEALSKALGDALLYDPRRLEGPAGWRDGRSGPWRATELTVPAGHVGWLVWWAGDARAAG
ncbi:4'-phosphopantetheinyl transferase family protein [Patulibacter minatonensis]|uniref:4'-phosphopantetheinyl transferase family protein n=1 Tax=Patulibacter minatonensis TaxID=298163 RepID=UPI0012FC14E5|nr:4'-phosphopantetheinyl transferase superfamily protein [Patulibacter minatonensis]